MMPANEEAPSIRGPVYMHQSVPSFYSHVARFARRYGPKLDRSLIGTNSDDCSLRTVGGQAPKTLGIDLRWACDFAAPHIEREGLPGIPLRDAVQADRRWRARTLYGEDGYVFEDRSRSSASHGNGEKRRRSLRTGGFRGRNIQDV